MVNSAGWLDQLFGPGDRLVVFDQEAKERRVGGDGRGGVEVTEVGNPPKRRAQIGQFGGKPFVRVNTVPPVGLEPTLGGF